MDELNVTAVNDERQSIITIQVGNVEHKIAVRAEPVNGVVVMVLLEDDHRFVYASPDTVYVVGFPAYPAAILSPTLQ